MTSIHLANPTHFAAHRSGWSYVINNLQRFNEKKGIMLDDFVEITFGYNYTKNVANKRIPYQKPWIGFLHHPPHICPWYNNEYKKTIDISNIFSTPEFLDSLKYCKCLFVLSNYLKNYLQDNFDCFKNIPIRTLYHPTEFDGFDWDFTKFKAFYLSSGVKVLTIGYFLRNLSTIFSVTSNKKLDKFLMPSHLRIGLQNLQQEILYKKIKIDTKSVKILNWQTNFFYDKMLEQSVVLLDLYDTSCNNAIIESFSRNSPLIINRHPAIEEYLGPKYPGFFSSTNHIKDLLLYDNICECNEYLKNQNKKILNVEYFLSEFQLALKDVLGVKTLKQNKQQKLICKNNYFNHRYGWPLVVNSIRKVSSKKQLMVCDFIDHTFRKDDIPSTLIQAEDKKQISTRGYNLFKQKNTEIFFTGDKYYVWDNEWKQKSLSQSENRDLLLERHDTFISNEWIGFVHNPIDIPKYFDCNQNIKSVFQNESFNRALDNCLAIFTLSTNLQQQLKPLFSKRKIPVFSIKHPTFISQTKWNFDMFLETKTLIQVGYWLRNITSFWEIKTNLNKIWLYGDKFAFKILQQQNFVIPDKTIENVHIDNVSDAMYDKYMRSSLIYLNYYSVSASNAILDCISSATPCLVNKLPPNIEYLGQKYPLYFDTLSQVSKFTEDNSRILDAHYYLMDKKNTDQFKFSLFEKTLKNKIDVLCKK